MRALAVVAAFMRRDLFISLSYRATFALQVVSMVFLLALFFYLGRVVDNQEFAARQGLSGGYFGYAAVGLALIYIVQAVLSSFSRKLREEQTTGTLEALMATPASPSLIVLASAAYGLFRATAAGTVLIATAVAVYGLSLDLDPAALGMTAVALTGCLGLFTSLGVAVAAFTIIFQQTTALLTMVVAGLALLGGVYFPIDVLPAAIQPVAKALPFTWGLDVLRASLLGGDVDPAQLAGLFASAALLLPMALLGFTAAVRHARRVGSLAQY